MKDKLFIPEKICVGYQERTDTYTGKLAYVIYYDEKGVLRKERSWDTWRDKKINSNTFTNVPSDGFVLNKKAGGYSSGWNHRNTYARVYDPRGFEFEITVDNLLFILDHVDCSRGKGLESKFVYAWHKDTLILLPTVCEEFKVSTKFAELKSKKRIPLKHLKVGAVYTFKDTKQYVYLGKADWWYHEKQWRNNDSMEKVQLFYDLQEQKYVKEKDSKNVAELVSDKHDTYLDLATRYYTSCKHGSEVVSLGFRDWEQVEHCRYIKVICCKDNAGNVIAKSVFDENQRCSPTWTTVSIKNGTWDSRDSTGYDAELDKKIPESTQIVTATTKGGCTFDLPWYYCGY